MMRCFSTLALVLSLLCFSGCDVDVNVDGGAQEPASVDGDSPAETGDQQATSDGEGEAGAGLDLNLPNVNVKIGGKEGVKVSAPGVDVNVNGEEGVSVQAPNTDVEVK